MTFREINEQLKPCRVSLLPMFVIMIVAYNAEPLKASKENK